MMEAEVRIITCPSCEGFWGDYRALHQHLFSSHPSQVRIGTEGRQRYFEVLCPLCDETYRQSIKRGSAGGEFVDEFEPDIRLVGSDILLQHLIGEHASSLGV